MKTTKSGEKKKKTLSFFKKKEKPDKKIILKHSNNITKLMHHPYSLLRAFRRYQECGMKHVMVSLGDLSATNKTKQNKTNYLAS
jgi:hypothetical protein